MFRVFFFFFHFKNSRDETETNFYSRAYRYCTYESYVCMYVCMYLKTSLFFNLAYLYVYAVCTETVQMKNSIVLWNSIELFNNNGTAAAAVVKFFPVNWLYSCGEPNFRLIKIVMIRFIPSFSITAKLFSFWNVTMEF